ELFSLTERPHALVGSKNVAANFCICWFESELMLSLGAILLARKTKMMNSPRGARKNKQSSHLNLKNFSLRPGYAKKYFVPLILGIILFIGLFVPYQLVRSNATA